MNILATEKIVASGRYRKLRVRRKGKLVLKLWEDRLTGHRYAIS